MAQSTSQKVLVVDDEEAILELLKYNLEKEGYHVETAANGLEALEKAKKFLPNLVLMDIMMPKMDGVEACRQMRKLPELESTFIVFLTARNEEYSEIAAFDVGADDYITKPIKPRTLTSRLQAILRRDNKKTPEVDQLVFNELVIDRTSFTVNLSNKSYPFPKKEFELLYFLANNPNIVFSRDELLQRIWGMDVYVLARTVDVHVRKIREKIGDNFIATVKGVGYKFNSN